MKNIDLNKVIGKKVTSFTGVYLGQVKDCKEGMLMITQNNLEDQRDFLLPVNQIEFVTKTLIQMIVTSEEYWQYPICPTYSQSKIA